MSLLQTTFAPSNDISVIAVGTQATLSFHRGEALYTNEQWDELKAKVVPRRDEGVTVGGTKTRFLIELLLYIDAIHTENQEGKTHLIYFRILPWKMMELALGSGKILEECELCMTSYPCFSAFRRILTFESDSPWHLLPPCCLKNLTKCTKLGDLIAM